MPLFHRPHASLSEPRHSQYCAGLLHSLISLSVVYCRPRTYFHRVSCRGTFGWRSQPS